eukprot:g8325.t1
MPVCGFEVANLIQSGRGFRKTSSGDLAAAADYELGGNPFRETVLVEAVLQEIPAAIRRFDEQEIPRMLESLRNDIDRGWVEFALKDRGVLKNYRGRSGLSRFISGVARQKQKKIDAEPEHVRTSIARLTAGVRWNLLLDICDESQYRDLQAKDENGNLAVRVEKRVSQLEGRLRPEQVQKYERSAFDYQSRMMQAIDSTVTAPSTECISLLSEELLAGFAQQQARSRLAVKLRFIDNMTFPDIGVLLGVDQGTAHRIVNKTLEQVRDTIFRTDNEEVKRCWQQLSSNRGAGLLNETELEAVYEHLSECGDCRAESAAMVRSGRFRRSADDRPHETDRPQPVAVRLETSQDDHKRAYRVVGGMAVSAVAVLAAFGLMLLTPGNDSLTDLDAADNALRSERHAEAFARAESWLKTHSGQFGARRARKIVASAAEVLAEENLSNGRYENVDELLARAGAVGATSAQLSNLKVAAMRRIQTPNSLELVAHLNHDELGYGLDGQYAGRSGSPTFDERDAQVAREFQQAIVAFPRSALIRLNYAQFLFQWRNEGDNLAKSRAEFQQALDLTEREELRRWAQQGLGMCLFASKEYAAAVDVFLQIVRDTPEFVPGQINLAIAFERMSQPKRAQAIWRKLLTAKIDESMKRRIRRHLSGGNRLP